MNSRSGFLFFVCVLLLSSPCSGEAPLTPGDYTRTVEVDGRTRSYLVHVPPKYNPQRPTPLVLAFHGAMTNGPLMALATGLNAKADDAQFVVVYPNGTGNGGKNSFFLIWNSGGIQNPARKALPNDVKFTEKLLDDLAKVVNIDLKRVYATGMSNGGMMCYRLASELSQRIAAIAPVSGTMAIERCHPQHPVSVIHFHGTDDKRVPFDGPTEQMAKLVAFRSVEDTIHIWARIDRCPRQPRVTKIPDKAGDGTVVEERVYGPARNGAEVVLFVIKGGGHTWPGRAWPIPWLGKTTRNISANDLMWDFFKQHPMK